MSTRLDMFKIHKARPSKRESIAEYRFDCTFCLVLIGVIFALSLYVFCIVL